MYDMDLIFSFQRTLEDRSGAMMVATEQAQLMAILIKLINGTKAIEIGEFKRVWGRKRAALWILKAKWTIITLALML